MELKNVKRGRIREYADQYKKAIFMPTDHEAGHNPLWNIKADCAFPSATQNEINAKDAANLIKNGCKLVAEGANMPSTLEATKLFLEAKSCTDRPRRRMRAAWRRRASKWPRTAHG
jgi:glutamate dehydrogenase (NADP+)